ncbi:MAG: T9SS type A sorting domain-containing protein [Hymenobacteraceae bacterium]|nr:T9SS type A sorting domain-containing protein [Hymenobacteraceae bacterium]MDX5396312.1 T9SS type A sorting domain-containing protein [Hymenobacteraceae bacterium]MDX5512371.1 T9SS type A sorting domain-containing protein [Hymenobacteraceae bacterium]
MLISDNTSSHVASVTIPQTALVNSTVRMRISSDEAARLAPTACGNLRRGQVEDYAVYIKNPVGVKPQLSNYDFSVYPNPSKGLFNIELNTTSGTNTTLEVVNMLGQVLEHKQLENQDQNSTLQLDLTHLPTGVYLMRVTSPTATGVRKVVIE